MKFIHTSDWHLGKTLEGFSRLEEQEKFCEEFIEIVEKNNIDFVIIAGDIYDTYNPPAQAERLFFKTVNRLSDGGKRCIFIVAGNHDNPERLEASVPISFEQGIIVLGYPKSKVMQAQFKGYKILEAGEGYTKLLIGDEKVVALSVPYPSEKRLNDVFKNVEDENERQKTYSQKVGDIFRDLEKHYEDDSLNIAVSHLFVIGGENSDSERKIQLGGSLLVEKSDLPQSSQYTALGHLHKYQVSSRSKNAFYSGSPIQYSKTERNNAKCVLLVDIDCKADSSVEPKIEKIYLRNYKPIEVFDCDNVDEATNICEKRKDDDIFAYFNIKTEDVIPQSTIKQMKKLIKNIVEIKPIIVNDDIDEVQKVKTKPIDEMFKDYYKQQNNVDVNEDVMDLFYKLINEEDFSDIEWGDEDEAD